MKKLLEIPQREAFPLSENTIDILIESAHKYNGGVFILDCQRQLENILFRRNGMSFFGGQHTASMQP